MSAIDPDTAIKSVLALSEQARQIKNAMLGLRRKLARKSCVVVVFGAGGVGKTTLGRLLSPDVTPEAPPEEYAESVLPETYWLKSNPVRSVIVAPGQEFRVARHWPQLYASLSSARRAVVVYVGANGFHSLSPERTLTAGPAIFDSYLQECRAREIDLFEEVASYLAKTTCPLNMMTLVTKQDLWYDNRDAVRQLYETDRYANALDRIQASKGTQHFAHEYVYACLNMQNLKLGDGTTLALTRAGFEDSVRLAGQKRLFEVLQGFTK